MTIVLWMVPIGVAAVVFTYVAVCAGMQAQDRNGWSVAPDGLRIAGSTVLLLGALAAVWVGVGDHQARAVVSGDAPFDWSTAALAGGLAGLVGAGLLVADLRLRRGT